MRRNTIYCFLSYRLCFILVQTRIAYHFQPFFFFRCCQFLTEPTPCPSTTFPHLRLSSKVKRRPFFFCFVLRSLSYIYIYIYLFFFMCFFSGLDVRLGPVCVFFYRVCYNTSIARSQLSARCVYFSLCRASMDTCFASQISPFFFSAVLLFSRFGFPAPVSFNVLHREQPRKVKKKKKDKRKEKKEEGMERLCIAALLVALPFLFMLLLRKGLPRFLRDFGECEAAPRQLRFETAPCFSPVQMANVQHHR